ncbi:MAG: response regulator, partial [Pseudobdellovibrionaceae bacterium]
MAISALYHLLVVDDDSLITDSLRLLLPKHWRMTALKNPALIDSKMLFHAAMVDMHLTNNHEKPEGPEIIATLTRTNPQIEVIAMSGDLSLDLMEQCLKNGAQKFLAKPLMPDEVLATLEKIEAVWMMRMLEGRHQTEQIQWVGQSSASQD